MSDRESNAYRTIAGLGLVLLAVDYLLIPVAFGLSNPDLGAPNAVIAETFLSDPSGTLLPILVLSSLGGFLYLPAFVGLTGLLAIHGRAEMLLARAFMLVAAVLVLVQNTLGFAIVGMSVEFLAGSELARGAILAAATALVTAWFKIEFFIMVPFSLGTLLLAGGIRRAGWSRVLVRIVAAAGVLNLAAQAVAMTLGHAHPAGAAAGFLGLAANITWFLWVGVLLVKKDA